jgi:hypothetical protein
VTSILDILVLVSSLAVFLAIRDHQRRQGSRSFLNMPAMARALMKFRMGWYWNVGLGDKLHREMASGTHAAQP